MSEPLGERQAAILRAVVREYIRTGDPVGSRHLLQRTRLDVSPATVRNEMATLEALGYLAQPHTSAGRVPTDRGYRFVVDEIKAPGRLAEGQRRALASELEIGGDPPNVEELLRRASDVVSRFTHHAGAVVTRRGRPTRVRRVDVFRSAPHTATIVVIADNGRVEQRIVALDGDVTDADVEATGDRIGRVVHGKIIEDAMRATDAETALLGGDKRTLADGIAAAVGALLDTETEVYVGGVANLAGEESFERETLLRLYEALEQQKALLEALASAIAQPIGVRIGSELPNEEFRSCSIVVATFGGQDNHTGSVGVIGPTRMDYARVIATATTVARFLEGTLTGSQDEP